MRVDHGILQLLTGCIQRCFCSHQPLPFKKCIIWLQVGNAWTDATVDNFGAIFYWWTHALVSDAAFHGVVKNVSVNSLYATLYINLPLLLLSLIQVVERLQCNFTSMLVHDKATLLGGLENVSATFLSLSPFFYKFASIAHITDASLVTLVVQLFICWTTSK